MTIQIQFAANDIPITTVLSLPERVTQDRNGRTTVPLVIGWSEQAAQNRSFAQYIKKIARGIDNLRQLGLAAVVEVELVVAPREDARESLLPISDLFELRIRGVTVITVDIA